LAKTVVLAGDAQATVTLALTGHGAAIGARGLRRERAILPAHRVQLGGAGLLVDAQAVAAGAAVGAAPQLAAAAGDIFEAQVMALGDSGAGVGRQRQRRPNSRRGCDARRSAAAIFAGSGVATR